MSKSTGIKLTLLQENSVKKELMYDANTSYFAKLSFADMYSAYRKTLVYSDDSCGVTVGKINGDVICSALWRQMSYNPVRFGTVSPFVFNGKNDIFKFINNGYTVPNDIVTASVLNGVRWQLKSFVSANCKPNKQWSDEIKTDANGVVHFPNMATYRALKHLCKALRLIMSQNGIDFKSKSGPYRDQIIKSVYKLNPGLQNCIPKLQQISPAYFVSYYNCNMDEDREDRELESLQLTAASGEYRSAEQYQQVLDDIAYIKAKQEEKQY